jgi:hypothetical protein
MSVSEIDWHWFTGFGNGYTTMQINIPPALIGAQIALYGTTGGGTQYAGIRHFRRRLSDGSDEEHDFGDTWFNWPPLVADTVSSVTFALATGEDQEGWAVARMDFWV